MRRATCLLLASLVLATPVWGEDVSPDGAAFVELLGPERAPYEHEPYTLRLRVAYDPQFFQSWGAALFRRPLDMPLQITLPWDDESLTLAPSELVPVPPDAAVRIALNDSVVAARRAGEIERGGRRLALLEVERRFAAAPVARIEFPAPVLRFAYATGFEEDFFGGRRAIDHHDVRIEGELLAVEARALPKSGRPDTFRDAVGQFELEVRVEEANAALHRVVVCIRGRGNLETLTPPRLEDQPGLHVVGRLDAFEDDVRLVTWEVEATPEAPSVVPALAFTFFDPLRASFETQRSTPIALGEAVVEPPPVRSEEAASTGLVWLGLGLALLLGALLVGRLLLRRAKPGDLAPEAPPARSDEDPERALRAVAGAVLGRPPAAAVDAALAGHLVAGGMERELATRLASAIEALVAVRYGGTPPDAGEIEALLAELRRPGHGFRAPS